MIVGGITGGLFHVCEKTGLGFFTILIGLERAKHDRLRITRVWVGGLIVGLVVGLAIGVVDPFDWQSLKNPLPYWLVCFLGGIVGIVSALIISSYVRSVEKEVAAQSAFERRYNEKLNELIEDGVSHDEAAKEAQSFAEEKGNSSCFIATAVFGSPHAYEVKALRDWRDGYLLQSAWGRRAVSIYHLMSPRLLPWLNKSPRARSVFRKALTSFVENVARKSE